MIRRRHLLALAVVPLLLVACGRDQPASAMIGVESVAADDRVPLPPVAGPTLDGGQLDVADLRGRVVVLNSWASWCAPCREEVPSFVALADGRDPGDVALVGLNVRDQASAANAFVADFRIPYPSIVDAEGELLSTIPGVPPSALPSTVILDREGRIAARIIGVTDSGELAALIDAILEEGPAAAG